MDEELGTVCERAERAETPCPGAAAKFFDDDTAETESPRVLVDHERTDFCDAGAERRQFAARQHYAVALHDREAVGHGRDVAQCPRQKMSLGQVSHDQRMDGGRIAGARPTGHWR